MTNKETKPSALEALLDELQEIITFNESSYNKVAKALGENEEWDYEVKDVPTKMIPKLLRIIRRQQEEIEYFAVKQCEDHNCTCFNYDAQQALSDINQIADE